MNEGNRSARLYEFGGEKIVIFLCELSIELLRKLRHKG